MQKVTLQDLQNRNSGLALGLTAVVADKATDQTVIITTHKDFCETLEEKTRR